jgi:phage-related protein
MQVHYFTRANGRSPVREFVSSLDERIQSKIIHIIDLIQKYGIASVYSYTRKLTGSELWEIRLIGKKSVRLLYAIQKGDTILILHGFVKKTQKTPRRELLNALQNLNEYMKMGIA